MRQHIKGDQIIWLVVLLLSVFGVLAVYSSTGTLAYVKQAGNTEYYLLKHTFVLVLGLFIMWLAHLVDFRYYNRPAQFLIFFAIVLLILTYFFGVRVNSAVRHVVIPGIGLSFQTSDLAKIALIMYIARFLSRRQNKIESFKQAFLPIIVPITLTCILIAPNDLSTALVLFATCILLLFMGRIPVKYLLALAGIGALLLTLLVWFLNASSVDMRENTWASRVENFVGHVTGSESGEGYQNEQAKIAIAEGGILGKGPGYSTQRNFLPSPYADFIYAIIIEEYGLIGGVVIMILYLILLFRTLKILIRTPKAFGAFLAIGLSFTLVIQAMVHMGVVLHVLPNTGLPLPLISMGGTSLLFTSLALGIILSVSRQDYGNDNKQAA